MPAIRQPIPFFADATGAALHGGFIYIGLPGQNPATAPAAVYWDSEMTQPAAQPLRTVGGVIARGAAPAEVYVAGTHSLLTQDSRGRLVMYLPTVVVGGEMLNATTDFGADPSGAAESRAAFEAAAAAGLVWREAGTYKLDGASYVFPHDGFLGVMHIGDSNVNNSDDAVIIISRDVDASAAGNGHAFTDSSQINRTGGISYNSFDARPNFKGSASYGHYAAFQVGVEFDGSGTVTDLFSFISSPIISNGALTNYYGLIVNAPTINAPGTVANCWGFYAPLGYGKGGPGFNQATGIVHFFTNESHAPCYSLGPVQGQDGLIAGDAAGTAYTNVKTLDLVKSAGTLVGARFQQVGTQTVDLEIPASQTYFNMRNAAGSFMKALADRAVVWNFSPTVPTLANFETALTPISDTLFQISYRGSDGVLRKNVLTMTV